MEVLGGILEASWRRLGGILEALGGLWRRLEGSWRRLGDELGGLGDVLETLGGSWRRLGGHVEPRSAKMAARWPTNRFSFCF